MTTIPFAGQIWKHKDGAFYTVARPVELGKLKLPSGEWIETEWVRYFDSDHFYTRSLESFLESFTKESR